MKFFVLTVLSFTDAISFITGMKGEILVKVKVDEANESNESNSLQKECDCLLFESNEYIII